MMLRLVDLMMSSLLQRLLTLLRTLETFLKITIETFLKARGVNTAEPRNFRKNDPTKVNNIDKPREKVGQSSNNSMGP